MTEPQSAPAAVRGPIVTSSVLYALLVRELDERSETAIEVVDIERKAEIRTFSIGVGTITSLAVARDGSRLYVVDVAGSEVAIFDSLGDPVGAVGLEFPPRDCVLSRDGAVLYVSTRGGLVAIDTATNEVVETRKTEEDDLQGIAVSPDEKHVGAVSLDTRGGGTDYHPALYLFDTETLTPTRVAITDPDAPAGAALLPMDVVFTDTGRAILWDGNCDSFYQVDVASAAQDPAGTARLGRDAGESANFNNVVAYSRLTRKAYALKEFQGSDQRPGVLAVLDVASSAATTIGGFAAQPFALALQPDKRKLYVSVVSRFSGGGADVLDELDLETESFVRGVYTFQHSDMSVRDMAIL
jgi:DNA-binding beta-propeller fold protein YncE